MAKLELCVSPLAPVRQAAITSFLEQLGSNREVLLCARRRTPLDELVFRRTQAKGHTFGLRRCTLRGLATELALPQLLADKTVPPTRLAREALVAAALETVARQASQPLPQAVATPGFTRALAATLHELESTLDPRELLRQTDELRAADGLGLLPFYDAYLTIVKDLKIASERDLYRAAAAALKNSTGLPVVLADLINLTPIEALFVEALCEASPAALATLPAADQLTRQRLEAFAGVAATPVWTNADGVPGFIETLHGNQHPASFEREVSLFAGAGEYLESIEIARAIHGEAARGVPFDEMAVVISQPQTASESLSLALARAGIPAHFEEGVRAPDASGRALLSLLHCRLERGSPARLFEYLSIAHVGPGPAVEINAFPGDAELAQSPKTTQEAELPLVAPKAATPHPRRWAAFLAELGVFAASVDAEGGRQSIAAGLAVRVAGAKTRLQERLLLTPESSARALLERELVTAQEVQELLLPILEDLDRLPERGPYSQLLPALEQLAARALYRPELVLATLTELHPLLTRDDEVELLHVVALLASRLSWLESRPSGSQFGKVLITTPEGMAARARRVVFITGLADGTFPASPREDPLLPDTLRQEVRLLATNSARYERERLRFLLAIGSATERLFCSYSRVDLSAGRGRVPSAFFVEASRALTRSIDSLEQLESRAKARAHTSLLWPGPHSVKVAIDGTEYALAHLRGLRAAGSAAPRGAARFLFGSSPHLFPALASRFKRNNKTQFTDCDGFMSSPRSALLAGRSLRERAYAPSTLELFAACPYRFFLRAVVGLRPKLLPASDRDRLEPRVFGELYHRCQALLTRELRGKPELDLQQITALCRTIATQEAERLRAEAAPRIARVFEREVERLVTELSGYFVELVGEGFEPLYGDLSFGLPVREHLDESSSEDAVCLPNGALLLGALDAVEQAPSKELRITDFKTGKAPRASFKQPVIGGGEMLQPLLYAMALEALLVRAGSPRDIVETRLYYSNEKGAGRPVAVPVDRGTQREALAVLDLVEEAIQSSTLVAYPRKDACKTCPYIVVCGPNEEGRVERKRRPPLPEPLKQLDKLRTRP